MAHGMKKWNGRIFSVDDFRQEKCTVLCVCFCDVMVTLEFSISSVLFSLYFLMCFLFWRELTSQHSISIERYIYSFGIVHIKYAQPSILDFGSCLEMTINLQILYDASLSPWALATLGLCHFIFSPWSNWSFLRWHRDRCILNRLVDVFQKMISSEWELFFQPTVEKHLDECLGSNVKMKLVLKRTLRGIAQNIMFSVPTPGIFVPWLPFSL